MKENYNILLNVVDIDFGNYRCSEAYVDIFDNELITQSKKRLCDKKKDIREIRLGAEQAYVRFVCSKRE